MEPLLINISKIGYQIQNYIPLLKCLQLHINQETHQNPLSHSTNNTHFLQRQGEDKRYYCTCKKSYRSLASLRQHKNDQLRKHECKICNKTFTRKNVLRQHLIKHFGPLYKCVHCPKSFYSPIDWINHHKKHTLATKPKTTCLNKDTISQQNPSNSEKDNN